MTQSLWRSSEPITDQRRIRARNLDAVAQYVRAQSTCSRGEIGTALNLNKATVSSLVGELIERGMLENGDRIPAAGVGRPSTNVQVDSTQHASVVVEIFPGDIRISAWSLSLTNVLDTSLDASPRALGPEQTMPLAARAVAETITSLEAAGRHVVGIVVAVPGPINPQTGVLARSKPLGWTNVAIRERLIADIGRDDIEVRVARPAALTTIAEWQSLPNYQDMICVHAAEHGIGTGLVIDGSLVRGGHGHAGVVIAADQVGLTDLLAANDGRSIEQLAALLDEGDPDVRVAMDVFTTKLVDWLVPVVALLDTRAVVLADYLQVLGAHLVPNITSALEQVSAYSPGAAVDVRLGTHGPGAFRIGGAVMLADHAFEQALTR